MLADTRRRHHAEVQALRAAVSAHAPPLGAAVPSAAGGAHAPLRAEYVGREVEQLAKERDYLLSCLKTEVRARKRACLCLRVYVRVRARVSRLREPTSVGSPSRCGL